MRTASFHSNRYNEVDFSYDTPCAAVLLPRPAAYCCADLSVCHKNHCSSFRVLIFLLDPLTLQAAPKGSLSWAPSK